MKIVITSDVQLKKKNVISLLAFLGQAHTNQNAANHDSDAQALLDALVRKSVGKLVDRVLRGWSLHHTREQSDHTDMDGTTLAKTHPDMRYYHFAY